MTELVRILEAVKTAALWHAGQTRKGTAKEPYLTHLLDVAMLVADATNGADADLVIAALLHDATEDQKIPNWRIAELFGKDVAGLVAEVTDDRKLSSAERKAKQIEHGPMMSTRAKILKVSDKTANLRSIVASPPEGWSKERKLEFVSWARKVVAGMEKDVASTDPWLMTQFKMAAALAEEVA